MTFWLLSNNFSSIFSTFFGSILLNKLPIAIFTIKIVRGIDVFLFPPPPQFSPNSVPRVEKLHPPPPPLPPTQQSYERFPQQPIYTRRVWAEPHIKPFCSPLLSEASSNHSIALPRNHGVFVYACLLSLSRSFFFPSQPLLVRVFLVPSLRIPLIHTPAFSSFTSRQPP